MALVGGFGGGAAAGGVVPFPAAPQMPPVSGGGGGAQAAAGTAAVNSGDVSEHNLFAVEIKKGWSGDWKRVDYLEAVSYDFMCAPNVGQAVLALKYGEIKWEDEQDFNNHAAVDGLNFYFRIVDLRNNANPVFTGIIEHTEDAPFAGKKPAGDLMLNCYGICQELDREPIMGGLARAEDGTEIALGTCPDANKKFERGPGIVGNRSTAAGGDGCYLFSSEQEEWTALDLAEMLLKRCVAAGGPKFELAGQKDVLKYIVKVTQLEGRTVWDVLTSDLIPLYRGVGFAPIVKGDTVQLVVYTCLDVAVSMGDVTLPANSNPVTLDLGEAIDIVWSSIQYSGKDMYDRVIVQTRENILACGTFSYLESSGGDRPVERDAGEWVESWTLPEDQTQEGKYRRGSMDTDKWKAIENRSDKDADGDLIVWPNKYAHAAELQALSDNYRNCDFLAPVFTHHELRGEWNGTAGGQGLVPVVGDDGEIVWGPGKLFRAGKGFETFVPFREHYDSTKEPPEYVGPGDEKKGLAGVRRLFALLKVKDDFGSPLTNANQEGAGGDTGDGGGDDTGGDSGGDDGGGDTGGGGDGE